MSEVQYELVAPSALPAADRAAWRAFVSASAALGSPYFAFEFALCCEEARRDTRVLVARRAGQAKAYLPLHVGKAGYARPLAGPLGDVQGVIAESGFALDMPAALAAVNIPVFNFESMLASQTSVQPFIQQRVGSWMLDLSAGFQHWRDGRKSVQPKAIRNLDMRRRRMERLDGGYSFVMADQRAEALATMMAWKREQYRRTRVFDVFSVKWTRRLLAAVLRHQSDHFSGLISTLNIGDEIAAVHVGMASDRICHYWFPAYNADFGRISPGLLMIEEMAKTAASLGHQALELGPGEYPFKRELASFQTGLAAGYAVSPSLLGCARRMTHALVRASEAAPLGRAGRWPGKAVRKVDRIMSFHAA